MRESSSSRGEVPDGSVPQAGLKHRLKLLVGGAGRHGCIDVIERLPCRTPLDLVCTYSKSPGQHPRHLHTRAVKSSRMSHSTLSIRRRHLIPDSGFHPLLSLCRLSAISAIARGKAGVQCGIPRTTQPELPPLPSWPDFPFFDALEPGVILHRLNRLTVPIGERQHGTLTPGQEYFVEVEINHWAEPVIVPNCREVPVGTLPVF